MSHQQLDANQIAQAFAAQFVAFVAQQQALLVEAQPKPRPAMNAAQSRIYDAVENGFVGWANIGRAVGFTKLQAQAMGRGMLYAGMLTSRNGVVATA